MWVPIQATWMKKAAAKGIDCENVLAEFKAEIAKLEKTAEIKCQILAVTTTTPDGGYFFKSYPPFVIFLPNIQLNKFPTKDLGYIIITDHVQ